SSPTNWAVSADVSSPPLSAGSSSPSCRRCLLPALGNLFADKLGGKRGCIIASFIGGIFLAFLPAMPAAG
ncbi:hypothetical protein C0U44_32365, partial [Klebsiella pneumoniae]